MRKKMIIEVNNDFTGLNLQTENLNSIESMGILFNLFSNIIGQRTTSRIDQLEEKINAVLESNEQARKDKEAGIEKRITKREAAEILGICSKTLDNYIKKGHLPYYQFKSKILLKKSDLIAFMDKQTKQYKNVKA